MSAELALGVVGSVSMLVVVFELLRRRHLREKYAVLWIIVAIASVGLTVFPGTLTWMSRAVGVEVPSNLLFFLSLLFLLLATIQHSFEVGRLEEKTRTLAEEIALLRLEVESGDHSERPPQ